MNIPDSIGSFGVAILLLAYLLNLLKKISSESISYILMNLIGAGLACLASVIINYVPFIILETAWMLVSFISLIKIIWSKKTT